MRIQFNKLYGIYASYKIYPVLVYVYIIKNVT